MKFYLLISFFFLLNNLKVSVSSNQTNIYNHNNTKAVNGTVTERKIFSVWPNGTKITFPAIVYRRLFKGGQVDCFGLGSTIASGLDWLFQPGSSHTHALDIQFTLTSRKKPHRVHVLTGNQFGLEWTDFKIERKTVIIVHGFLSDGEMSWIREMDEAYRLLEDVNVVTVDWSAHGNTWNYYKAAVNTRFVGREIAKLLSHIVNATEAESPESSKSSWGPIHMIGHSLGAHICGVAADEFKKITSAWKITRITGLDPAQPCFSNSGLSLDVTDAPFVDIIHTNGQLMSRLGLGLPQPIGHVDFYPNGGKAQPGCVRNYGSALDFLNLPKHVLDQAICSHGRSYVYFTESINAALLKDGSFWAHTWDGSYRRALKSLNETCDSNTCSEMGINAPNYSTRGLFFVVTSSSKPFYYIDARDWSHLAVQLQNDFRDEYLD